MSSSFDIAGINIGDRFECIETIRDGDGPCWEQDGSYGYPEFEPGQQVEVSRCDPGKLWPISVTTPNGCRVDHYDADKLRKYFKKI